MHTNDRWHDMGCIKVAAVFHIVALAIVGVGGRFACDSSGWDVTTPSEAYAWSSQPPQGCTCKATDVSLMDCKVFDCGCVCDLTAGSCDVNCCCDAECTEVELARFAELDSCLEEGPADEVTSYCYSTEVAQMAKYHSVLLLTNHSPVQDIVLNLARFKKGILPSNDIMPYGTADVLDVINTKFPLTGGGAAQEALDGLLCVQYDNSDSNGEFYEDPGILPISIFSDDSGTSEFSYHELLTASTAVGSTEGDVYFDKGDRIPAARLGDSGGTTAAFGGFFPLPVADDAGRCNEANFVGFDIPVPAFAGEANANVCATEVESLADHCAGTFGWGRFSENLYAGTTGTVSPSETFNSDAYVQVKISSTVWRDWETGEEHDFSDVNCATFYYDPSDATAPQLLSFSGCLIGGGGGDTLGTTRNETVTAGCKNALASVCYTVAHNGAGTVTAVSAALVLTDIPPGPNGSSSSVVAPQRFAVEFRLDGAAEEAMTKSQTAGNLVKRARSGNPGYMTGLPLLAGSLETSAEYEYIASAGNNSGALELMAGEGSGCDSAGTVGVEFGFDGVGCCVLSLTRDDLQEHCEGAGRYLNPDDGFTPLAFRKTSSAITHIGGYGNADPLDVSQWVELPFSSSANTAVWDDEKGVCSSVVSALEYRMLYASVGAKGNPQSKIVSAEARYGKTGWVWREETADEQKFLVCNSVSFRKYGLEAERYTLPSPPVAFTVPWDVFYPFSVSTTSGARAVEPRASSLYSWRFITGFVSVVIVSVTSLMAQALLQR